MGSLGSPKLWVPYINSKDCSLGFCSLYCPQWCYVIYPPPPPEDFSGDDDGRSTFSPLIISIIGILTAAFLLVSYFTLVSKYCRNNNNDADRRTATTRTRFSRENSFHDDHDVAWNAATTATEGLDEALIKQIPVITYKKGDGVVEGTAMAEHCSVCLGEFREDERLRALPKCSHAFHVECIDTWLRSHSNCPLCRANVEIGSLSADGDQSDGRGESVLMDNANGENDVSTTRVFNDLEENHTTIEVRDSIRRSISMDFSQPDRVYVADILRTSEEEEEEEEEEEGFDGKANCSKWDGSDRRNYNRNVNRLHVRSVSSGRFFLSRSIIGAGKGKKRSNSVIPL